MPARVVRSSIGDGMFENAKGGRGRRSMDHRREQRERGTADATLVPLEFLKSVYGDLPEIELRLAERAQECAASDHTWFDPKTRVVCLHCGSVWVPQQD
jgi:DnaJ-class molecular chaperone